MKQSIGPKELAQRELQKNKLSRAHQMMIEDGCPEKFLRTGSGPKIKRPNASSGVALAPPLAVQKAIAADLEDDEVSTPPLQEFQAVAKLREKVKQTTAPVLPVTEPAKERAMKKAKTKKTKSKKVAAKAKIEGAVRAGSKLEIVSGLLQRPEGCTAAEILAACGWPSVSVPAMAKAAGLVLSKEKDGKVSRYHGVPAAA